MTRAGQRRGEGRRCPRRAPRSGHASAPRAAGRRRRRRPAPRPRKALASPSAQLREGRVTATAISPDQSSSPGGDGSPVERALGAIGDRRPTACAARARAARPGRIGGIIDPGLAKLAAGPPAGPLAAAAASGAARTGSVPRAKRGRATTPGIGYGRALRPHRAPLQRCRRRCGPSGSTARARRARRLRQQPWRARRAAAETTRRRLGAPTTAVTDVLDAECRASPCARPRPLGLCG